MKRLKLTKDRQGNFLKALANTGSVTATSAMASTSRTRVYELRKADSVFAAGWEEAEESAADRLEEEARRRAVEGVQEPLVSAGKIVRDDDGLPIAIRRQSDTLLLALLKAHRPERFKERAVVEHDVSDKLAGRLEAARQRAMAPVIATTALPSAMPRLVRRGDSESAPRSG